jgi:hypothetical protein
MTIASQGRYRIDTRGLHEPENEHIEAARQAPDGLKKTSPKGRGRADDQTFVRI